MTMPVRAAGTSVMKQDIDAAIKEFFDRQRPSFASAGRVSFEAFDAIESFVLREGKRLRPRILLLAYHGYATKGLKSNKSNLRSTEHEKSTGDKLLQDSLQDSAAMSAAVAVELLHAFFLVHDDVMDQSDLRRGQPTLHKLFERQHPESHDPRLGESIAICAGDVLYSLAIESLLHARLDPKKTSMLQSVFFSTVHDTCLGQIKDLEIGAAPIHEVSTEDILDVARFKTASYSIEMPLSLGAIIVGADETELHKIKQLSLSLGLAFQIQDDILGLFGDEKAIGKPVMSDVKEGKKTLLVKRVMEHCNEQDAQFIHSCIGNKQLTLQDFERLKSAVRSSGILEQVQREVNELTEKSKKIISTLAMEQHYIKELLSLAQGLATRKT